MGGKAELLGKQFGRLTVLERESRKSGVRWRCQCSCGEYRYYQSFDLASGRVVSCGCYNQEKRTKHGLHKSKTYNIWHNMKMRCNNPKDTTYKYYGGRGISYTDRWEEFLVFLSDMGECPSDEMTLDRINTDGNYEPSNCRWVTRSQQQRNKRPYTTWNQKITDEQVAEILISGATNKELANKYGVSSKHISAIRKSKRFGRRRERIKCTKN